MLSRLSQRSSLSLPLDDKMDDQISLPETASTDGSAAGLDDGESSHEPFSSARRLSCDACPHCDDRCSEPHCLSCAATTATTICREVRTEWPPCRTSSTRKQQKTYTRCQIRRHNHENSAWIVVGDTIYDATPFLHTHPGGTQSILRKSGGVADCTRDFEFHSKKAQKMFKKSAIGKIRQCPSETGVSEKSDKEWWVFW